MYRLFQVIVVLVCFLQLLKADTARNPASCDRDINSVVSQFQTNFGKVLDVSDVQSIGDPIHSKCEHRRHHVNLKLTRKIGSRYSTHGMVEIPHEFQMLFVCSNGQYVIRAGNAPASWDITIHDRLECAKRDKCGARTFLEQKRIMRLKFGKFLDFSKCLNSTNCVMRPSTGQDSCAARDLKTVLLDETMHKSTDSALAFSYIALRCYPGNRRAPGRYFMEYSTSDADNRFHIYLGPRSKIDCQPSYSCAGQRFDRYISNMQQSHPELSITECESPVSCNISLTCDVLDPNIKNPNGRFRKDSSKFLLHCNEHKGYMLWIVDNAMHMPVTDTTTCYNV
eukprot:362838_1